MEKFDIFMGYLPAGYPDRDGFLALLESATGAGLDILEVGFPSKNPFADGKVIRDTHRAIDHSIAHDMAYWRQIRENCPLPLWIMGYSADLVGSGAYLELARAGVVDAFVIPDCDARTFARITQELAPLNVDMVPLVRPDDSDETVRDYFQDYPFVYYQLFLGETGSKAEIDNFTPMLGIARKYNPLRILAGFGISNPTEAQRLLDAGFDGFIVGTAMVRALNESPQALQALIREIRNGTRRADA